MDEFDRFMSRQRALKRAGVMTGQSSRLWSFHLWNDGRMEDHHLGRRKFNPEPTIKIPSAMHEELTRRGEEEHPPLGSDPDNELERQARLHLGFSDMHAGLSDAHRAIGETMLAAAEKGECDTRAVQIPKGLLGWIVRIAHDIARAARDLPERTARQ